jgi:uncharacterized membrane protein
MRPWTLGGRKSTAARYRVIMLQRRLLILCFTLSAVDLALVALYRLGTHDPALDFLIWNLALAWVPLVAALALDDVRSTPLLIQLPLFALWLAFFPNAPYLVTDIVHIDPNGGHSASSILGTLAIIGAAPVGLALGFSSLLLVERNLRGRFGGHIALAVSVVTLLAACAGIYLGRVVRLNSWDLLSRPRDVLMAVHANALDPNPMAAVGTLALAAVLATLYLRFRRVAQQPGS